MCCRPCGRQQRPMAALMRPVPHIGLIWLLGSTGPAQQRAPLVPPNYWWTLSDRAARAAPQWRDPAAPHAAWHMPLPDAAPGGSSGKCARARRQPSPLALRMPPPSKSSWAALTCWCPVSTTEGVGREERCGLVSVLGPVLPTPWTPACGCDAHLGVASFPCAVAVRVTVCTTPTLQSAVLGR